MNRLVSIQMPAFNAGRWIGQAIASCLAQTHREIEVLVVDDGSTDNTGAIAAAAADRDNRVRLIRHDKNRGEGAARNTAVAASRGAYIARLDADDWDLPTRIEKSLARLDGTPRADAVSCQCFWCEGTTRRELRDSPQGMIPELFMYHRPGGSPINASIVAKAEIYRLVGRFDETLEVGTDSDWDIRAVLAGIRWAHIPEPLYCYRRHPDQAVRKVPAAEHNRRQLERCKAQQPAWEDSFNNPNRTLEIYTNSACTRSCRFCSQADFIKASPGYEISLAGILEICERAKENGATYEWVQFTGGEPLLWEDLAKAAILAKQLGPFKKVRILTNLDKADEIDALLQKGTIDGIYTTMANNNGPAARRLFEKYPNRIRIDHLEKFKALPTKPHPGTRPADCHCPRFSIIGRDVYPCGNFFNHVTRLGQDPRTRPETCSIDEDWIAHFRTVDRFNMDICEICLGNGKVWNQTPNPKGP